MIPNFEDPAMWYQPDDEASIFKWAGGYIDVGYIDPNGEFTALDCINVYGRSEAMTLTTFQEVCDAYLREESLEDMEERAS